MTIYAKSFIAFDGNKHLTSSTTVQLHPYDHCCCHLCGTALLFHPEWGTNRPWFEHTWEDLTENGRYHCPYVHLERQEARRIRIVRRYVPDVLLEVCKADWHCSECNSHYHGERYCFDCRTGYHSTEVAAD
ncbi:hypothetical protein GV764_05680 [Atlantibacter hermannii]|nr:hypothetical protein [Atlantibacter hermannii]